MLDLVFFVAWVAVPAAIAYGSVWVREHVKVTL